MGDGSGGAAVRTHLARAFGPSGTVARWPHRHKFGTVETAVVCKALIIGGQGRNRTTDTRIFSPLLYQLSYLAVPKRHCCVPARPCSLAALKAADISIAPAPEQADLWMRLGANPRSFRCAPRSSCRAVCAGIRRGKCRASCSRHIRMDRLMGIAGQCATAPSAAIPVFWRTYSSSHICFGPPVAIKDGT